MQLRIFFFLSILVLWALPPLYGSQHDSAKILTMLNDQIEESVDIKEKAKLCCFMARNYLQAGDEEKAEQSYLEALEYDFSGWILNEYTRFLYNQGQYERTYRAATTLSNEFPHFSKDAEQLRRQAAKKYKEEYYAENPPTIIMHSSHNKYRLNRHDVTRKVVRGKMKVFSNDSAITNSPSPASGGATKRKRIVRS